MTPIQHILVATDFGAASTRALEVAAEVAGRFGAKVTIVHTIEGLCSCPCDVPPEIRRSANLQLEETVKRMRHDALAVAGALREGFAWREIIDTAEQVGVHLVVVGSHGLGHGGRFLLGSVAEKVVRLCSVPVLTVHAWRFEDRTHAGRELSDTLLRSDEQARAVVALSRGGAVVAAEVAEAFGASLYMLLAGVLERDGRVIGAICEDGTMHLDGQAGPSEKDDVQESARRAQAVLEEQARHMHGHRWVKDGIPGTVLLVSDAILTAAPTIAVAKAIRRRGPHRLIAAAPVASIAATEAVRPWVDGLVVLQVVEDGIPLERSYCNLAPPSERAIVERLAMTAQWAQALERQP